MSNQFTQKFENYACIGDSISVDIDGTTYTAYLEFDHDYNIDDDDMHNPDQSVTGCNEAQQTKLLAARQAWFDDEWFYCGVVIRAERDGWKKDHLASLWGIECNYPESDNSYLTEVANELLSEAIAEAA